MLWPSASLYSYLGPLHYTDTRPKSDATHMSPRPSMVMITPASQFKLANNHRTPQFALKQTLATSTAITCMNHFGKVLTICS